MTRKDYRTATGLFLWCQGVKVTDEGCSLAVTPEVIQHVRLGRLFEAAKPETNKPKVKAPKALKPELIKE